jgi:hypothetical protein
MNEYFGANFHSTIPSIPPVNMMTSPDTCAERTGDAVTAIWFAMSMGSAIFFNGVLEGYESPEEQNTREERIHVARARYNISGFWSASRAMASKK